jgi:L-ribulose-5-phosphate 3-epimerase
LLGNINKALTYFQDRGIVMKNIPYQIGVMQGRLLPKYKGRYQAHPVGYWQEEFKIAHDLGLGLIEFILDFDENNKNPLLSEFGLREIADNAERNHLGVKTICADYFMEAPLHSQNREIAQQSLNTLLTLISNASKIKISDIVIPCIDQSTFKNEQDINRFVHIISPARDFAEQLGINLSLETDLAPEPFLHLLEELDSPIFTVNYDTGNSAALGYNPIEELSAYGSRISDIHIKDRLKGGGSVVLGTGDTDFLAFFSALQQFDYRGPFIMQAYRDEEGVNIFKKQLTWFREKLAAWEKARDSSSNQLG